MDGFEWLRAGPIHDLENPYRGIVEFLEKLQDPDNGLKFLHADMTPFTEEEIDALRLEQEARRMGL